MPSRSAITTFNDAEAPPGVSAYLPGRGPTTTIEVVPYDPGWPDAYAVLAGRVTRALGPAALAVDHVGSTSVPGLAAKPIIDIDLIVADSTAEGDYVPHLEPHGFTLLLREPWWYEHRLLIHEDPRCNLHVWSLDCPEPVRHRIFRDWLIAHPQERDTYLQAKRAASEHARTIGGHSMDYNAHKQAVIREIYSRAFVALGLLQPASPSGSPP